MPPEVLNLIAKEILNDRSCTDETKAFAMQSMSLVSKGWRHALSTFTRKDFDSLPTARHQFQQLLDGGHLHAVEEPREIVWVSNETCPGASGHSWITSEAFKQERKHSTEWARWNALWVNQPRGCY